MPRSMFGQRRAPPSLIPIPAWQPQGVPINPGVPAQSPDPAPQGKEMAKQPGPNLLGVLADALAGAAGTQPMYLSSVLAQRKYAADAAQAERERSNKLADWRTQYDYEAAHPKPSDDAFTRAMEGAGIKPGSPEYIALAHKRAEMLTNPVQLVPDGMGGQIAVRPNGGSDVPTAPVGRLTPLPGGPTPQASGGFHIPSGNPLYGGR